MACETVKRIGVKIGQNKEGFIRGTIDIRRSGEHFFGVQTVFARMIDRWAKERDLGQEKNEPQEEKGITYTVKTLF